MLKAQEAEAIEVVEQEVHQDLQEVEHQEVLLDHLQEAAVQEVHQDLQEVVEHQEALQDHLLQKVAEAKEEETKNTVFFKNI